MYWEGETSIPPPLPWILSWFCSTTNRQYLRWEKQKTGDINFYYNGKKFKTELSERLLLFTGGWSSLACSPYALYNPGSCNCLKPKNTLPVSWFHSSLGLTATSLLFFLFFSFLLKILFSILYIWNDGYCRVGYQCVKSVC